MKEQGGSRRARGMHPAMLMAASLLVPFLGVYAASTGTWRRDKKKHISALLLFAGLLSIFIYSWGIYKLLSARDARMTPGCISALNEISVLEEQYYMEKGHYTKDVKELGEIKHRFGAWLCDGVDAKKCGSRFRSHVGKYCRMKTLEINIEENVRTIEIRAKSKNLMACPVCVNASGYYPVEISECTGMKEYVCVDDTSGNTSR